MAERRMLSKKIVDSDAFMDMALSTQAFYFHLLVRADDDGFVGNPKKIMRMVGASDDEYKFLVGKRFILEFPSGVCVIKHWLIHNLIRGDRYNETQYIDEKKSLFVKENKSYTEVATIGIPNGNQMATQVRLGKVSIVKEEITLPDWLDKDSWNEWIQYRKSRKLTTSKITLNKQIKLLEQNKETHKQIIEKSITMGWQGLFPEKSKEIIVSTYFIEDTRTGKKAGKKFSSKEEAERYISLNRDWDDIRKFLKVTK